MSDPILDVDVLTLRGIIAAAEERGRRKGIEEARKIADGEMEYAREGGNSMARCIRDRIAALAPRNSAPADDYCATCNSINGTHQAWCDRKPRDSGKEP